MSGPLPRLCPKIIPNQAGSPGAVVASLDEARKWPYQVAHYGFQDLLAYSSYKDEAGDIYVADMNSMQLVQTLHAHNSPVTCIQWKPPAVSYLRNGLFLFTGDTSGTISIWDVTEGVVLNSVQVPGAQPVHVISLLTKQHLLVLTGNCSSFVYDSHLMGRDPFPEIELPFRSEGEELLVPLRMCTSNLSSNQASCIVFADRIRVINSLDSVINKNSPTPTVKDLVYDSEDGLQTVFDATFSEAHEEVVYFATRTSVGVYEWKTNLLLNEQLLWHTKNDVEFRRIFPSSPSTLDESVKQLPFLYSFSTDQRLCAWFMDRSDKVTSVASDVRGARIASKVAATVVQSQMDANLFAVIFTDGSVARWRFSLNRRSWLLEGYISLASAKPTELCVMGDNTVCCALENGHITVVDVVHSVTLRQVSILHSGGTRIILLCPHRWGESVWVVTNKIVQPHHYHQVTLFNCRSGVVLHVLRRPTKSDATRMKEITINSAGNFLLLTFFDGTFEVWNVDGGGLIYFFGGMGVAGVSWAPQLFLSSLTGVQGTPYLLAIVFFDGTMSFWIVYKDRVIQNRDTIPLFHGGSAARVFCAPAHEAMVVVDGTGVPSVVRSGLQGFRVAGLMDLPTGNLAVVSLAVSKCDGENLSGCAESKSPDVCIALLFGGGSFGVWSASTMERLAYSKTVSINLSARRLRWMMDMLLVLTTNGDIAILDMFLTSVNSSVTCKALRRPLQSSAFFLPVQRTYIQTALETQVLCSTPCTGYSKCSKLPSFSVQNISSARRPCRGPFGQVITEDISTQVHELDLYKETMIPKFLYDSMQRAVASRRTDEIALLVARFFGQRERQRLWAQFALKRSAWQANLNSSNGSKTTEQRGAVRDLEPPLFYLYGNRFSEAMTSSEVVRRNHVRFNEYRLNALDFMKNQNVDDSKCRLAVARDLMRYQEHQKAIDVLMDANYENEQFPYLANLAISIAASASAQNLTSGSMFAFTAKRSAALLLARGDLNGAEEKFLLCGDYYEAGLALQSCGKWGEAATLAKVSPMTLTHQQELLYRWCLHCAKRGEMMEAASMLISFASFLEALALLSESAHLTDIAGLLAIVILEDPAFSLENLERLTVSPLMNEDISGALKLGELVVNVLTDYSNVMQSVENLATERATLELIASLKRRRHVFYPSP